MYYEEDDGQVSNKQSEKQQADLEDQEILDYDEDNEDSGKEESENNEVRDKKMEQLKETLEDFNKQLEQSEQTVPGSATQVYAGSQNDNDEYGDHLREQSQGEHSDDPIIDRRLHETFQTLLNYIQIVRDRLVQIKDLWPVPGNF